MRLYFLWVPILLCSAQENDIDGATNWLMDGTKPSNGVKPATSGNRLVLTPSKSSTLSCTTTDGKDGRCVKPVFCVKEPEQKDPTTLFTYREKSCHYLLQCCPRNQVLEKPKKTRTLPSECGWSNPGGYSIRSKEPNSGFSDFADFPWMVALLKQSPNQAWSEEDYIGGGTLIHPSVVLTVAHKVDSKDPSQLKCRAGEWDTQTEMEILAHQERNVKKIIVHDEFLQLRAYFDAALLILESPFILQDAYHIGVACLGRNLPTPGTLCYSMGWGRSFNDTNNAVMLKKIQLPLVDPAVCQRQLRNTRLGSNFLLHHSLMCAGGEVGVDTCVGDGGASLVCPLKIKGEMTRYAVYGMVAYGVGCGVKDVPGVYAKVTSVVEWVNRQMTEEGLTKTNYLI